MFNETKTEKKKDEFDYNSINEDSIQNENIENLSFTLNKVETVRYNKFKENHYSCSHTKEGMNKFRCHGGGLIVKIETTGIGDIVICICRGCNKQVDITDYDCW